MSRLIDGKRRESGVKGDTSLSKRRVQVVDFFSGCGGMSYGFSNTPLNNVRYDLLGGIDIDRHANSTYRRMLKREAIEADIESLREAGALEDALSRWGVSSKYPLLVIGYAPCQGFSSHRKRYVEPARTNSLLTTFADLILRIMPDVVVMENVPEILQEQYWAFFSYWRGSLERAGYSVRVKLYNLAQFGVPQERFRTLVIASRNWRHFRMPFPTHRPREFVTVRQAIGHLPVIEAGGVDPQDPMHITSRHRPETVEILRHIPPDGGSQRDLPPGIGPACLRRVDGFRDVYGRMSWDLPSNAITTRCRTPSAGRYAHPEQHRGLSVREAALLQGFPPDFYFEGPFDDKFKQIGNAVSPRFAAAVAMHLDREWILDHDSPVDTSGDVTEPIRKSISSSLAALKRRMRARETDAYLNGLSGAFEL